MPPRAQHAPPAPAAARCPATCGTRRPSSEPEPSRAAHAGEVSGSTSRHGWAQRIGLYEWICTPGTCQRGGRGDDRPAYGRGALWPLAQQGPDQGDHLQRMHVPLVQAAGRSGSLRRSTGLECLPQAHGVRQNTAQVLGAGQPHGHRIRPLYALHLVRPQLRGQGWGTAIAAAGRRGRRTAAVLALRPR